MSDSVTNTVNEALKVSKDEALLKLGTLMKGKGGSLNERLA